MKPPLARAVAMQTHDLDELRLPPGEASRRAMRLLVPVTVLALVAGALFWGWTRIALNQEHDLPPLYESAAVTLQGVDWGHVHSELIPAWLMDAGSGQPSGNALTRLRGELAGVPPMLNAMERMAGSVNALSAAEGIQQRRQAVDDWNDWMLANGVPLLLRLPSNPRWQSTYLLSYYRLAQVTVHTGSDDIDVVIDTRVDQLNLREGYAGHTGTVCPDITNDEVSDLRRASAALRGTLGLFDGLQRLNAFAGIEVAVHESAHALRNMQADSATCVECPFGGQSASAHEYDAFLASLSHGGIAYSSLAMMCQLVAVEEQNQHTQAISHVLQRVGYANCVGPVPEPLAEIAQDVRRQDLGSSATFVVEGMPEQIRPMYVR
jgi:hypothetical protein